MHVGSRLQPPNKAPAVWRESVGCGLIVAQSTAPGSCRAASNASTSCSGRSHAFSCGPARNSSQALYRCSSTHQRHSTRRASLNMTGVEYTEADVNAVDKIKELNFTQGNLMMTQQFLQTGFYDNWPYLYESGRWEDFWENPLSYIDLGPKTDPSYAKKAQAALELVYAYKPGADEWAAGQQQMRQDAEDRFDELEEFINEKSLRPELDATWMGKPRRNREMEEYYESWDEWDYRAWMEKRRRKERENEIWRQKMDAVGQFKYLNITDRTDVRLRRLAKEEPRLHTHEEIWNCITMNGLAADPAKVKVRTENPDGKIDYIEDGVAFVPDVVEYLEEIGHLMERPRRPVDPALDIEEFEGFETELPAPQVDGELPTELEEDGALDGDYDVDLPDGFAPDAVQK